MQGRPDAGWSNRREGTHEGVRILSLSTRINFNCNYPTPTGVTKLLSRLEALAGRSGCSRYLDNLKVNCYGNATEFAARAEAYLVPRNDYAARASRELSGRRLRVGPLILTGRGCRIA